jgi:phosphoribosylcarboxyaminoimidazole (NCAIR) mutase
MTKNPWSRPKNGTFFIAHHTWPDKAGAKNAAVLAVQILALSDKKLAGKLARLKIIQAKEVAKKTHA